MIEVKVPNVGESISEVQVQSWLKKEGDWVASGTDIVELETEKASVQLPAPVSGYIRNIVKKNEDFAAVGDLLCSMEEAEKPAGDSGTVASPSNSPASEKQQSNASQAAKVPESNGRQSANAGHVMPAAARMMSDQGISADSVSGTGPGGRVLKEDVARHADQPKVPPPVKPVQTPVLEAPANKSSSGSTSTWMIPTQSTERREEVKPMSMIRRTIAARLVQAQHDAALLTTFNEINMQPVMTLRSKYKDAFFEKHGVKLGFMSFFSKAATVALQRFPNVNAEIRGNNIVFKNFCDIGIAIGGGKGLVVPVLRSVEHMSFAQIERSIGEFSKMAMENRLTPSELEGGTFTISNGGIYGSLLSTPIVNPPQSAILGLHAIQERPVAVDGQVVIQPMMYVALSYDHRIVDGREAVTFLRTIKETIEDSTRLFLEL
jgi:2-oxoglutarate dehydrogenase E2 component (dihydrolipoamide succinyltransferase)